MTERAFITDAQRKRIMHLLAEGFTYAEIAGEVGRSKSAVASVIFRARNGNHPNACKEPREYPPIQGALKPDAAPAKYPYASDHTCPDFAWDDDHIAAVASVRPHGFPVAFIRYSRPSAA